MFLQSRQDLVVILKVKPFCNEDCRSWQPVVSCLRLCRTRQAFMDVHQCLLRLWAHSLMVLTGSGPQLAGCQTHAPNGQCRFALHKVRLDGFPRQAPQSIHWYVIGSKSHSGKVPHTHPRIKCAGLSVRICHLISQQHPAQTAVLMDIVTCHYDELVTGEKPSASGVWVCFQNPAIAWLRMCSALHVQCHDGHDSVMYNEPSTKLPGQSDTGPA